MVVQEKSIDFYEWFYTTLFSCGKLCVEKILYELKCFMSLYLQSIIFQVYWEH